MTNLVHCKTVYMATVWCLPQGVATHAPGSNTAGTFFMNREVIPPPKKKPILLSFSGQTHARHPYL